MASGRSVMERLKERRKAMQDTQESNADFNGTTASVPATARSGSTWGAAMETTGVRHQPGVKMLEDVDRADGMVEELVARRSEKKKELSKSLKTTGGDVSAEIRSARKKSRDKVKSFPDDEIAEEELESATLEAQPADAAEEAGGAKELRVSQGSLSLRRSSESFNALREKLRSKVQSGIKGKLEAEKGKEDDNQPQRTLKGRRDRPATFTRFDDSTLTREQAELEEQLSKSQEMRSKWKQAIDKSKNDLMPSKEEQMEFFTNTFDDEGEEDEKRTSAMKAGIKFDGQRRASMPSASATGDQPELETALMVDEDKDEDTTEDTSRLIPKVPEDLEGRLWFMTGAEYIPSQEKIADEETQFYVPSSAPVPMSEKMTEECEARDLAAEGIYVGRKPLVTARERYKMENRLLHEPDGQGKQWFGEDGEILSLPDPVKPTPSRPVIPEKPDSALQMFYRKAITKEYDSRYIDGTIDSGGQYRLEVDVNTLTFLHHDLMSREHVLASRLCTLSTQYQERRKVNVVEYHSEKIRALKSAIVHLKESLLNYKTSDVEKGDDHYVTNLTRRLKDYTSELRDLRRTCDAEEQADRELLRNITKTWTSLKHLRSYQNCTNTPVRLNFTKTETDRIKDKNRIKTEIADEVEEQREEFQQTYDRLMTEYESSLAKYKQQLKAKKEAAARLRRRKRQNEDDADDLLQAEQDARDQAMADEPELAKPEVPNRFDEKLAREKTEEKFKQIKRRPGEPILIPEISYTMNVTSLRECPVGEQQRREAVQSCRLYAKVFFNRKEVAKTDTRQLNQDFTVSFAQIIPIHIIQWPDSVYIQVYEVGMLKDRYLCTVYAAIPATSVTASDTVELDTLDFATEQKRVYSHEAVGSGLPVTFDIEGSQPETITLLTSGQLLVSVTWGVDSYGNPLIPVVPASSINHGLAKGKDAVTEIGASAMMDMEKLSQWLSDSRIDPNDPANSELVYLLRPKGRGDRISGPEYFRLEQLQEEFNFVTDEELNSDRRLLLLELREKEVMEFRNMKMIPANAVEISADIFKDYNKRLEKEAEVKKVEGDSHRALVTRFIQRVREQVLERRRLAAHQKSLQEIVIEESVPNIATIVLNLGNALAPRRPLRPRRKERKAVSGQNLQDREVKVMVNITRAYNIPCRVMDDNTSASDRNVFKVRPFFEIMFQREKKTTSVAEGRNPSWNEELNLSFMAPNNDYSSTNLQTVKDSVYINLFDEYVTDVLEDDRQRGREVHTRLDKKWLGGIQIPFATLYANGVVEGAFRLDSPAVLLGYTKDTGKQASSTERATNSDNTYVNMFMTIEPSLGVAPDIKEAFESNEAEELLDAASKYMEQLEKSYPTRAFTTAVIDVNGKHVFVTKYFKPLAPPEAVLALSSEKQRQMENVARYVSLIPYLSDSVTFPGMCDLWSTCDQFLQMLTGDEEEHAVLLTNYFLHLQQNAYLCIGMAIPEGITAYTLVIDEPNVWVWNAMRGERYAASDTFCPLVTVGCLINSQNIWANIQKWDSPNRMSFNVNDAKAWRPFFTSKFPNPGLPTVQPENLIYFDTDQDYVRDLQERLEQHLKDKFEKSWRPRDVTRWNRNNMQIFRHLLAGLEMNKDKDANQQHRRELENVTSNYKLSGFTLNMPYTDKDMIADSVYATGVWENDNRGVEFALAVHIHPYPHSVLSVWVYVASLERLR